MATTKSTTSGTTSATEAVNAAADPVTSLEPLTPTTTHYQQVAITFSAALDEIASDIPKLEEGYITTVDFVRSHLNVPLEFIAVVIAAVEQAPELQRVGVIDPVEARNTLQMVEAFRPIVSKVTAFLKTLELAVNSRLASLGNQSLQMYQISRQVARDPKNAAVKSLHADMKRAFGRRGRPSLSAAARKRAADALVPQASAAPTPKEVSGS
jgi:hypothetical protein